MRVALGTFARSGIEARFGTDVPAGAQAALLHYTRRLMSGWPPIGIPRFISGRASGEEEVTVELSVSPEIQAALEREARRHQVPVRQVLEHAVFVYLADLDSASEADRTHGAPVA